MRHPLTTPSALALLLSLGLFNCADTDTRELVAEAAPVAPASAGAAAVSDVPNTDIEAVDDASAQAPTSEEPTTASMGPNELRFVVVTGHDGAPCVTVCNQQLAAGGIITLELRYVSAEGEALEGQLISFSLSGAEEVSLSGLSTYTNAEGRAQILMSASDSAEGTARVSVSVPDDDAVTPIDFLVDVYTPERPPLRVDFSHGGAAEVDSFEAHLYRVADGEPTCAALHPDRPQLVTPTVVKGGLTPSKVVVFDSLPDLASDESQIWTVVLVGPEGDFPLVFGCRDGVALSWGETVEITIAVNDLPLRFADSYDLMTRLDLVSGLEGDAGAALALLFNLFTEPGRTALEAACTDSSGTLETVCDFLVDDGELTLTGGIVADAADVAFFALISEALGVDVAFTGEQLTALLQNTRLHSSLALAATAAGVSASGSLGQTYERWDAVEFFWTFGAACDPSDDSCGSTVMPLESIYGVAPSATYEASATPGLALEIPLHLVPGFTFGPLVNGLVELGVLPLLFGDGSEGLPPIDSYEDLVATLLGDKYCLLYDDCCEYFATKLEPNLPAWALFFVPEACEQAISAAASWIRDQVGDLEGTMTVGTPAEAPCTSFDSSGERVVTSLGTANAPCHWDMRFELPDSSFRPENTWTGALSAESQPVP